MKKSEIHIPTPEEQYAQDLCARHRAALLRVGKSPDAHIYDLTKDFVDHIKNPADRGFFKKITKFYASLNRSMKEIFVKEVLEMNRHYKWWYWENYRTEQFNSRKESVLKMVAKSGI